REIVRVVHECHGAPGRLERVPDPAGRVILVDYAHTDDALARVLDAMAKAAAPRIVCVFGCGGDRDRGKRPLMGEAAGTRADLVAGKGHEDYQIVGKEKRPFDDRMEARRALEEISR